MVKERLCKSKTDRGNFRRRRYPVRMPRILGQDRALGILQHALRSERFHHAWVFTGPRGVGKFTTAMELARILLDPEQGPGAQIGSPRNGESRVQRLIDAGTHPDLHVIRKELALFSDNRLLRERKLMNIPLDLLRERVIGGRSGETMHEAAAYRTAALGHGKVFIIDEADLLRDEAQNAMLKTLEEPPAQTYFFLITSLPDHLLPTVRSRCQMVPFGRLDERAMQQWWKQHEATASTGAQNPKAGEAIDAKPPSPAAIKWALNFAEGAPGMTMLALEYGFHDWQMSLDPMLRDIDRGVFPAAMGDLLGRLVEDFAVTWVRRHGEKQTSKDAANKDGARHVFALLGSHARNRLAAASAAGDDDVAERWAAAIDLQRETEEQIGFNVNQKLAMDNLVAQWTAALSGAVVV
jgi:hypothetical protein